MKKFYLLSIFNVVVLFFIFQINVKAQATAPVAQALQFSQNFSTLAAGTVTFPAGIQGWFIGSSASATFRTTAPTSNTTMIGNSNASVPNGGLHNYNGKIGMLATATLDPSICVGIITTGKSNIQVNFDVMTIRNPYDGTANTAISGIDLQYRVGAITATWISVSGQSDGVYQNNTTNQVTAITTPQNPQSKTFTLPADCDNQSAVYLRWVMRNISGTIGPAGRPSFAIDNIIICPISTPTISISGPSAFCTLQTSKYISTITNGGATPVYQWKKNGTVVGSAASILFTSLIAGDQISCTLTSSAGCLTTTTANSNVITIGTVASPPTISSAVVSNVSCAGIRNGSINITVAGGTPPYNYYWDTTNITNGPMFAVTVGMKALPVPVMPAGIGFAFFIDGVESKVLNLTKGITYAFGIMGGHPFHISTDSVGANGNSIVLNGETSTPLTTGTYNFRPVNSNLSTLYYPCSAHQYMGWKIFPVDGYNVEDPTNLKAGKYSVSVMDANECITSTVFTVFQGSATITGTLNTSSNVSCYGQSNGTIDVNPSGGTAPYKSSGTGPTFIVSASAKNHSHPQFGSGSANGFTLDGVQGKELTLMRGIKYAFSVLTPGHPFFISSSSVGGPLNLGSEITNGVINSMTTSGTLFFTPDATHPNLLYYQCGFHNNMGWKINIVDQSPNGDLGNCMAGDYNITVSDVNGCSSSTPVHVILSEPSAITYYYDGDNDTYGLLTESAIAGCSPPPGFVLSSTDCDDNAQAIHPGASEICNNVDDNCDEIFDPGCPVQLCLKVLIEGYYPPQGPGTLMDNDGTGGCLFLNNLSPTNDPADADYITISAMDATNFSLVQSQTEILKTNGDVCVTFVNPVINGTQYYIRVTHRNALETWSAFPEQFKSITTYDFTNSLDKAFTFGEGNPDMLHKTWDGKFALLSGDISDGSILPGTQDGNIDLLDFPDWDLDNSLFNFGYLFPDFNGDTNVDLLDYTFWEFNNILFSYSQHP